MQRLQGVGIAAHQGITHAAERRQPLADPQPQQQQADNQRHAHWHRGRQQHRQVQGLALDLAVSRGDAHITAVQGEGAPGGAVYDLIMKTRGLGLHRLVRVVVAAGQDLAAQGADLARHAAGDGQLLGTEMGALAFNRQLRQLLQQPGDHAC